jgi:hypothetical protein
MDHNPLFNIILILIFAYYFELLYSHLNTNFKAKKNQRFFFWIFTVFMAVDWLKKGGNFEGRDFTVYISMSAQY